jgi:hypothetical protein
VSNDFRNELSRAFDQMSGPPSPTLNQRVRSSLAEAPERHGPYWIAGLAAAAIAVLVIGVLVVANPLGHRPPPIVPGATSTPTASATSTPSAQPSATPSAQASPTPAVACSSLAFSSTSPGAPPVAFIDALRTGSHTGYDRLTIEFKNGQPGSVDVQAQNGTVFMLSPSGQSVTLKGTNGILVTIHGADLHTDYSGSLDIVAGYSGMVEVRRVQDFEGVVQIALGVHGTGCFHASWLANPARLVIDVPA